MRRQACPIRKLTSDQMTELAAWFVQQSIFTEDKAIVITCRLQREFWIDSLVLLRDGIKHDPGTVT
jgi:hypothetical protein